MDHRVKKNRRVESFDMEILIAYILLAGVLISSALLAVGLVWHWARWRDLRFEHSITGMNFFEFILSTFRQVSSHEIRPRFILNLGIGILMLTPFVRVLASVFYFILKERNWKYTLFTGFVFCVLTYSLFLR
ncbi:MAG: DUF1634 domain-containing protein [Syntrophaceae bacterium]|nr:DUF1634 domain-containing protein [Syntrophaceae bacterium]